MNLRVQPRAGPSTPPFASHADSSARTEVVPTATRRPPAARAAVSRADAKAIAVSQSIPIVTANRLVEASGIPSVVNDDAGGIRQMLRHLISKGHRNIGHIAGPDTISTGVSRREAFIAEARTEGLNLQDGIVVSSERYTEDEGHRCQGFLAA